MQSFAVYVFDYDGTLAATRAAAAACLALTIRERGQAVSESLVDATIARGVPLEAAFAGLLPGLTGSGISACVTRYREVYPAIDREMTSLFDGVAETLAALHRDGRKIVVLSNKGRTALESALARFDLLATIDAVLAADPGEPVKPDPEAFHRRVRPLFDDMSLTDFVMVGDTAADIGFAHSAGIACCWVSYGYGDADTCLSMKPDFIAGALSDLLAGGAKVGSA